jgi:enolase
MQRIIRKKYGQDATNVGDEGGFAPNIQVILIYFSAVVIGNRKVVDWTHKTVNTGSGQRLLGQFLAFTLFRNKGV